MQLLFPWGDKVVVWKQAVLRWSALQIAEHVWEVSGACASVVGNTTNAGLERQNVQKGAADKPRYYVSLILSNQHGY